MYANNLEILELQGNKNGGYECFYDGSPGKVWFQTLCYISLQMAIVLNEENNSA